MRRIDFPIILILHLMNHLLMFSLPVLILYLREDFNLNYTQTGWLWTTLIVMMTTVSIGVGLYADNHREGRYPLIYIGLFVMIAGWFVIPQTTDFGSLLITFGLIGFGASGFHPPAMAIITEMFENDKGKALSINMAIGMGGTAISPLLFAGIAELVGSWENVSLTIAVTALLIGVIMLAITAKSGMFGRTDWDIQEEFVVGTELSKLDMRFLFSPLVLVPLFYISIRSSFFRTSSLFTSLLYEDYLFLTKAEASVATAIVLGIASMFTLVGGTISDRTKPRVAILISSIGTIIAAWGLVFLADYSDLISFSAFYFLLNAFYYIASPATSALLADRVDPKQRGKMFGSLFSLGQVLSLATPVIFGWIKDNQGLNAAFVFILILASIAFIIGIYIFYEEIKREQND